MYINLVRETLL